MQTPSAQSGVSAMGTLSDPRLQMTQKTVWVCARSESCLSFLLCFFFVLSVFQSIRMILHAFGSPSTLTMRPACSLKPVMKWTMAVIARLDRGSAQRMTSPAVELQFKARCHIIIINKKSDKYFFTFRIPKVHGHWWFSEWYWENTRC